MAAWIEQAMAALLAARNSRPAWGYRAGSTLASEPTALAGLALLQEKPAEAKAAAEWLAGLQQADGSVGVSAAQRRPAWPTALAMLLWESLDVHAQGRQRAAAWLLGQQGMTMPREAGINDHDPEIIGWPWVDDTHSWIEPTAQAILALRGAGQGGHARVRDGLRLIRDRALPRGGWNYGNTIVLGNELRPHPAPSGLSLLALAGTPRDGIIDRGCDYLERTLPGVRAPMSLAWGVLGLSAWQRRPPAAERWLEESAAAALQLPDSQSLHLALLLLAQRGRMPERKAS